MIIKPLKLKPCAICKKDFKPYKSTARVCSPLCAEKFATQKRLKKEKREQQLERKKTKEALEAIKPKQKWLKEAQQWVNKYVRLRDRHLGCCSCDKPATWQGQWHASHFRSTKAASAVRFNLWNIHKSCSQCNNFLSGNIIEFEPRLRQKIGNEKVDWLRTQNQCSDYSIEYLKRLKGIFKKRCAMIEKRMLQ